MGFQGRLIPFERGTLSFPWGDNRHIVDILQISAIDDPERIKTMGPGMVGYGNNATGRAVKRLEILGNYTVSAAAGMIAFSELRGSATIQLGSGETWTGNIIVLSSALTGQVVNKLAVVKLSIEFYGATTITRVGAGT